MRAAGAAHHSLMNRGCHQLKRKPTSSALRPHVSPSLAPVHPFRARATLPATSFQKRRGEGEKVTEKLVIFSPGPRPWDFTHLSLFHFHLKNACYSLTVSPDSHVEILILQYGVIRRWPLGAMRS